MKNDYSLWERFCDWLYDQNGFLVALAMTLTPILLILGIIISLNYTFGVHGFGPEKEMTIQVQRLYVDSGKSSHYMVGTDQGVLEVSNFIFPVQIFNSDEIYSQLEVGKTYSVTVKGNKVLNWWFQEYPYIIKVH
jgi:hypothetical protein